MMKDASILRSADEAFRNLLLPSRFLIRMEVSAVRDLAKRSIFALFMLESRGMVFLLIHVVRMRTHDSIPTSVLKSLDLDSLGLLVLLTLSKWRVME
jgi:hypothetical protein